MSGSGLIELPFADGIYRFRLGIGELRELQDKSGTGPLVVIDRLRGRDWRVDDVRETVRLGLIGAGMAPTDAHLLCVRYIDQRRRYVALAPVALAVLIAALADDPADPAGEATAGKTPSEAMGASSSRPSMAAAPSSASLPATSTA